MIQLFHRVWNDIKRGENIDLYVTVVVALVLAILNLLGFVPANAVAPITLAILGLIAVVLLGSRHRLDELVSRTGPSNSNFFVDEFPETLKLDFEQASEVWLIGISLSRTVKTNYNLLEQKLQRKHKIRALLVHPEGVGIEVAVSRTYGRRDIIEKSREVKSTLLDLCDIRRNTIGQLEVRTTTHPLAYGGFVINPNSDHGILYLENYEYRMVTESLPKFVLKAADGKWFNFYRTELAKIWEDSTEWPCGN